MPSEGYLTENETADGSREIEELVSDLLLRIEDETYLLECQSYQDDSMAIRIAEYAFITARQSAVWDIGHAVIPMPAFCIIYIKRTDKTPLKTSVTFTFPDGQEVTYESDNVILEQFTKESIVEKKLFPYIPFYAARYEKDISAEKGIDHVVSDLTYFRDELLWLRGAGELSDAEMIDLMGFVNTILTHITNGNQNEERALNVRWTFSQRGPKRSVDGEGYGRDCPNLKIKSIHRDLFLFYLFSSCTFPFPLPQCTILRCPASRRITDPQQAPMNKRAGQARNANKAYKTDRSSYLFSQYISRMRSLDMSYASR